MNMRFSVVALTLPLILLAGCGSGESPDGSRAVDPSPTVESPSYTAPTDVPRRPEPGTVPAFEPQNYTYTYEASCYCPGLGEVEVVVKNGEVISAVYTDGREDTLPEFRAMTIQEIIDEANKATNDEVRVRWPDGQLWPNFVFIDRIKMAADDEVGYTINEVTID